jgi:hypothetical protein
MTVINKRKKTCGDTYEHLHSWQEYIFNMYMKALTSNKTSTLSY